ncbi:MAG: BatA domain-containing protein, partial [Pirellulaceae bacterium]
MIAGTSFTPLVAFWQFGSAWMLAWAIAAALPILIHLWSRRKFREESWAAMEFLLAAMRKNARRIQVEQWLLLAVRTAILVLLALALADPQLSLLGSWSGPAAAGQSHVVLVLDGSYSMAYQDESQRQDDKSRFDAARDAAKQWVADGRQGDGYTLVLMGQPPRVVIGQPAFDPEDVSEELDNLQPPQAGANLSATLAEVETILRQAAEREPRLARKQVVFFTDLQQTTWGDVAAA